MFGFTFRVLSLEHLVQRIFSERVMEWFDLSHGLFDTVVGNVLQCLAAGFRAICFGVLGFRV